VHQSAGLLADRKRETFARKMGTAAKGRCTRFSS
jgi:hypothetical protein